MLTRLRKREQPTVLESPELTHMSSRALSCYHYRSGQPIPCVPIIRCARWIRAALVNSYTPQETREPPMSVIARINSYLLTCGYLFSLSIGRPIHSVPIIRCDRWILAALPNDYAPQNARATQRAGTSCHMSYLETCEPLFSLPIGPSSSLRSYNSLRQMVTRRSSTCLHP